MDRVLFSSFFVCVCACLRCRSTGLGRKLLDIGHAHLGAGAPAVAHGLEHAVGVEAALEGEPLAREGLDAQQVEQHDRLLCEGKQNERVEAASEFVKLRRASGGQGLGKACVRARVRGDAMGARCGVL